MLSALTGTFIYKKYRKSQIIFFSFIDTLLSFDLSHKILIIIRVSLLGEANSAESCELELHIILCFIISGSVHRVAAGLAVRTRLPHGRGKTFSLCSSFAQNDPAVHCCDGLKFPHR